MKLGFLAYNKTTFTGVPFESSTISARAFAYVQGAEAEEYKLTTLENNSDSQWDNLRSAPGSQHVVLLEDES